MVSLSIGPPFDLINFAGGFVRMGEIKPRWTCRGFDVCLMMGQLGQATTRAFLTLF
jgi:hypothetical protein